jgi:hypothetical protein
MWVQEPDWVPASSSPDEVQKGVGMGWKAKTVSDSLPKPPGGARDGGQGPWGNCSLCHLPQRGTWEQAHLSPPGPLPPSHLSLVHLPCLGLQRVRGWGVDVVTVEVVVTRR